MAESAQRVPEGSEAYQEFARLYAVARQLRPSPVDRWNRELYATSGLGGFDQATGAIGMPEPLLRDQLTQRSTDDPRAQAYALSAVLQRATQAGMDMQSPGEANAVRTIQSRGLNDGVASVRAAADFQAFTRMAGYPNLAFNDQESGAFAAVDELIRQTSGPIVDRFGLVDRLHQGPATMHFDQLAEAVVQNRLQEVAPPEGPDRQAVRRELISTMLHPQWDSLSKRSPADGRRVAGEIGQALNAKVDEICQRHHHAPTRTTTDGPTRETDPTTGATQLPDGAHATGAGQTIGGQAAGAGQTTGGQAAGGGQTAGRHVAGAGQEGAGPASGVKEAGGRQWPGGEQVPGGQVPRGEVAGGQVAGGQVPGGQVPGGQVPGGQGAKAHGVAAARFLTGMAPAGAAVTSRPKLGQGSRRPETEGIRGADGRRGDSTGRGGGRG